MKKLLFQIDTDTIPNTFDTVVAYDGGADHVVRVGGVQPADLPRIIDGAVFTRAPANKKSTALFVTGSNVTDGEALFDAIRNRFFGNFRVSMMLDSNGANTTAAAAVAHIGKHLDLVGKRVVILAGTGPVGQRAAVLLARLGASVLVTSRELRRAVAACAAMEQRFGVKLEAAAASDAASTAASMAGANIVVSTGAAGIRLLAEEQWAAHPTLELVMDANATPPVGIDGIEMADRASTRHGKICYGALGFGGLKLELQRNCVGRLFEANNQLMDAPEVFALAQEMVKSR
jgi:hypothetical protein